MNTDRPHLITIERAELADDGYNTVPGDYAVDPATEVVTPNVPEPIKAAILLMVGDLWHARATVATGAAMAMVPTSTTVEQLLQPFRVYR